MAGAQPVKYTDDFKNELRVYCSQNYLDKFIAQTSKRNRIQDVAAEYWTLFNRPIPVVKRRIRILSVKSPALSGKQLDPFFSCYWEAL